MTLKLLIADEHPIIHEGLKSLAERHGFQIVGCVGEISEIDNRIRKLKPDVLVCEIRLQGNDVIRALEHHSAEETGCRVVFFTSSSNPVHIARADTVDCFDYRLKTDSLESIGQTIAEAANGAATPEASLLKTTRKRARDISKWNSKEIPLTQRELQVLQHVAMGLSNREIGRALGISVETVKEHVQNTLRKLDANDRTQAAVWAVREGLI